MRKHIHAKFVAASNLMGRAGIVAMRRRACIGLAVAETADGSVEFPAINEDAGCPVETARPRQPVMIMVHFITQFRSTDGIYSIA